MEDHQMTEQEFAQLVERLRPRLMQMGREFFGSDTEADEVVHAAPDRTGPVLKTVLTVYL